MDRHIREAATPSDRWREWLGQHVGRAQDLPLHPWRRLVVVAPHPDDEVLSCGGLMQRHLTEGGAVVVVSVTDGEASHREVEGIDPEALGRTRRRESGDGLAILGIEEHPVLSLGIPDGEAALHAAALQQNLLGLLRPDDCVVTTWRLDGHPDHEATGAAVAMACSGRGCTLLEAPVWMWHWAKPGQADIPWHHLRSFGLTAAERDRKGQALTCHQSQLTPRGTNLPPVVDEALLQRAAWPDEYFFLSETP